MEEQTTQTTPVKRKGRAGQLSNEQHKAIELLLEGSTNDEIATELSVHVETVRKWRRSKVFARFFSKERGKAVETAKAILQSNATHAAQKLVEMIDDKDITRNQFNAAMKVLEMSFQFTELDDLKDRIRQLEIGVNREP